MPTDFKELKIWKFAFDIALHCYDVINSLPLAESNNIADQMRRACISLPLNIAEGSASKSTRMYHTHLRYAYASAQELIVLLMLCYKLNYIDKEKYLALYEEVDHFNRGAYKFIMNLEETELKKKMNF